MYFSFIRYICAAVQTAIYLNTIMSKRKATDDEPQSDSNSGEIILPSQKKARLEADAVVPSNPQAAARRFVEERHHSDHSSDSPIALQPRTKEPSATSGKPSAAKKGGYKDGDDGMVYVVPLVELLTDNDTLPDAGLAFTEAEFAHVKNVSAEATRVVTEWAACVDRHG